MKNNKCISKNRDITICNAKYKNEKKKKKFNKTNEKCPRQDIKDVLKMILTGTCSIWVKVMYPVSITDNY